jgi:hypothetical protein
MFVSLSDATPIRHPSGDAKTGRAVPSAVGGRLQFARFDADRANHPGGSNGVVDRHQWNASDRRAGPDRSADSDGDPVERYHPERHRSGCVAIIDSERRDGVGWDCAGIDPRHNEYYGDIPATKRVCHGGGRSFGAGSKLPGRTGGRIDDCDHRRGAMDRVPWGTFPGSGSITIVSLTTHSASGTFSFNAMATGHGAKVVSNGAFNVTF